MGAEHKATIAGALAHHMVHKKHVKLFGSYSRNYTWYGCQLIFVRQNLKLDATKHIFQLTSELSSRDVCFTFSLDMWYSQQETLQQQFPCRTLHQHQAIHPRTQAAPQPSKEMRKTLIKIAPNIWEHNQYFSVTVHIWPRHLVCTLHT